MDKIRKAAELAEAILLENGVNCVLACQTENGHTLMGIHCSPNELLKILYNIVIRFQKEAEKQGVDKTLVMNKVLGTVMQGLTDGSDKKKE